MIPINVNNQTIEVPRDSTIADLLQQLGITSPAVAVELNLEIQPYDQFEKHKLQQGDSLEIVTLTGGG